MLIGDALAELEFFLPDKRVIIITDSNLLHHHRELVERFENIVIGLGERHKTLATIEDIYRQLLTLGVDRECFILGIGGGIVTDAAGFAASTYMRGLSFGFVATSLLAQVDASVGGKNGVNLDGYKNIVGTFNQPDFVLCDTAVLETLPEREFRAGLAEIIKSGVIADRRLFELFEEHSYEEFRSDKKLLTEAISAAVRVKAAIVEADEREAGERKLLNLGHTFAHAIEKESVKYIHGEAVSIGLAMICELSERLTGLSTEESLRIKGVLAKMGLPTESPVAPKKLLDAVRLDKKRDSDSISLILVEQVGKCRISKISFEELDKLF